MPVTIPNWLFLGVLAAFVVSMLWSLRTITHKRQPAFLKYRKDIFNDNPWIWSYAKVGKNEYSITNAAMYCKQCHLEGREDAMMKDVDGVATCPVCGYATSIADIPGPLDAKLKQVICEKYPLDADKLQ